MSAQPTPVLVNCRVWFIGFTFYQLLMDDGAFLRVHGECPFVVNQKVTAYLSGYANNYDVLRVDEGWSS